MANSFAWLTGALLDGRNQDPNCPAMPLRTITREAVQPSPAPADRDG